MKNIYTRNSYKKYSLLTGILFLLPFITFAQGSTAQELLVTVSLFINHILLPFFFGIAFLFFMINIVRYFIIGGANESDRDKAKRSAFYGIAAFVLLLTIWGIVNIIVQGVGIDSDDSLCPDYLDGLCGNNSRGSFSGGSFPEGTNHPNYGPPGTNTTGGSSGSSGSGSNTNNGNSGSTGSGGNSGSGSDTTGLSIADLIFGTGRDSAAFTTYAGEPRAQYTVPNISTNATCESGMQTLQFANRVETVQAAYVLYKDNVGATHWQNITDLSSANHISYDEDVLDLLLATNVTDVHIINTHPQARSENLQLNTEGQGPSAADLTAVCTYDRTDISYAVVDWSGIWEYTQGSDTCPYTNITRASLPIIETYAALATVEASQRSSELDTYRSSARTPSVYQEHFANVNGQTLASLTPEDVLALSNAQQSDTGVNVQYSVDADTFCNSF
jgi:hypothetical protein